MMLSMREWIFLIGRVFPGTCYWWAGEWVRVTSE